jgi:hypothetical protein
MKTHRPLSGLTLTVPPTDEERQVLGPIEGLDPDTANEAMRWGLALARAAMPKIRRQQNWLARAGDRPNRRAW